MPRSAIPKDCACGCGKQTKGGTFLPGHDARLMADIIYELGGVENVLPVIEKHLRRPVPMRKRSKQ